MVGRREIPCVEEGMPASSGLRHQVAGGHRLKQRLLGHRAPTLPEDHF